MKLSILIPHLKSYDLYLDRLRAALDPQLNSDIELIIFTDYGEWTIGAKRNWLLHRAKGEYVCFIDSDDVVSADYIKLVMAGIDNGVDCCSLTGEITDDGKNPRKFVHSMMFNSWYEKNGVYRRPPNHLNTIKASIAKQIEFPGKKHGEDHVWSDKLKKANLIRTEHWIEDTIYYYLHRNNK
jgi:glycosyltransferase involved in cell wall biosynthesis